MKNLRTILMASMFFLIQAEYSQVTEQWSARYNFGSTDQCNAMKVDASGNVYVTGSSRSGGVYTEDIATNKYNSSGILLWSKRFVGTGYGEDYGFAITVDVSGNVYVTGRTWINTSNNNDIVTIKYNSAGDSVWVKKYNGTKSNHDEALAIAVDASGNVYVTGSSAGTVGPNGIFDDLIVIKYNSAGTELWNFRYNGPSGGLDRGNSIAVDAAGNIFVCGLSWGGSGTGGTNFDEVLIKLNSSGVFQWVNRSTTVSYDELTMLVLDAAGNVYATGFETSTTQSENYVTLKYNTAGVLQWRSYYNGPDNDIDEAIAIALDRTGNVYVTGKSDGGSSTVYDIATVKYSTTGLQVWASRFNGSSSSNDEGESICTDTSGNIYVTGYSTTPTTADDFETIKYNTSGVQQWEIKYTNSGSAGSSDRSVSVFADNSGHVYAAGSSALDYAVVKYGPAPTGIDPLNNELPDRFELMQNYPNPFNPSTNIKFSITENGPVKLAVYDITGKLVEMLFSGDLSSGVYNINFNASKLSSGAYFYRLEAGSNVEIKKMVLVK